MKNLVITLTFMLVTIVGFSQNTTYLLKELESTTRRDAKAPNISATTSYVGPS